MTKADLHEDDVEYRETTGSGLRDGHKECALTRSQGTANASQVPGFERISFRSLIPSSFCRVVKALVHALVLNQRERWDEFSSFCRGFLHPDECCELAFASLKALHPTQAEDVARDVFCDVDVPSLVPLFSTQAEAYDWAEWASPHQRKAYALACFDTMRKEDRMAFVKFLIERDGGFAPDESGAVRAEREGDQ